MSNRYLLAHSIKSENLDINEVEPWGEKTLAFLSGLYYIIVLNISYNMAGKRFEEDEETGATLLPLKTTDEVMLKWLYHFSILIGYWLLGSFILTIL